ncbi:MAG: NAD(P)H-binding protein [Proteobacteria bacterium]|nr:NAD(P)H-binding protein [Pseudomonadota bacterium]
MRILMTGATGFIGSHIALALEQHGHNVVCCVRSPALAARLLPNMMHVPCDFTADTSPQSWLPRLADVDVVINVAGIITETGENTFQRIHTDTPCALFDACKQAGIKQVIQVSALGVAAGITTAYNVTKLAADDYLANSGIPYTTLRPSWLYGRRSLSFGVLCAFAALPLIPVTGKGDYLVQPIAIEDFAEGVARLAALPPQNRTIEVGGPEQLTIRNILGIFRLWLGLGEARYLRVPLLVVRLTAKVGDLFLKGPVNSASFDMLTRHNITPEASFWRLTTVQPRTLDNALHKYPATPAQALAARLFFALPLLNASLAFMWIASGLIPSVITPHSVLLDYFAQSGITGRTADILLVTSLSADVLLGLGMFIKRTATPVYVLQIMLMLFYSVFLSISAPEWWMHPYGPLLKNIPLIAATILLFMANGGRRYDR